MLRRSLETALVTLRFRPDGLVERIGVDTPPAVLVERYLEYLVIEAPSYRFGRASIPASYEVYRIVDVEDDGSARAELHVLRGGPALLGLTLVDPITAAKVISLNARVVGTPLEKPILAHECAHLALGAVGGSCMTGVQLARDEQEAWIGAALLLVPSFEAALIRAGRASPRSLADRLEVPVPFVRARLALGPALGECVGGDGCCLGLLDALWDLQTWIESEMRALAGPAPSAARRWLARVERAARARPVSPNPGGPRTSPGPGRPGP